MIGILLLIQESILNERKKIKLEILLDKMIGTRKIWSSIGVNAKNLGESFVKIFCCPNFSET